MLLTGWAGTWSNTNSQSSHSAFGESEASAHTPPIQLCVSIDGHPAACLGHSIHRWAEASWVEQGGHHQSEQNRRGRQCFHAKWVERNWDKTAIVKLHTHALAVGNKKSTQSPHHFLPKAVFYQHTSMIHTTHCTRSTHHSLLSIYTVSQPSHSKFLLYRTKLTFLTDLKSFHYHTNSSSTKLPHFTKAYMKSYSLASFCENFTLWIKIEGSQW